MKKVIDISERLEKTTCDRVTNKTITYKEMYKIYLLKVVY